MAELEDFLDVAVARLQRLPEQMPPSARDMDVYRALVTGLHRIIGQAHDWIADFGWRRDARQWEEHPADQPFREPLAAIATARNRLGTFAVKDPDALEVTQADPAVQQVKQASHSLGLARELVRTHFGPDGEALTAYGRLMSTPGGHLYVLGRMSDIADKASVALKEIAAAGVWNPSAKRDLRDVAKRLSHAARLGHAASVGAPSALSALPIAASLTPTPLRDDETPVQRLRQISQACERIQQGADRATSQPDRLTFSGSDLVRIGPPLGLAHMLCGRILLTITPYTPEELRPGLEQAAESLRAAAHVWRKSSSAWRRIIDLNDLGTAAETSPNVQQLRAGQRGPIRAAERPLHPAVLDARAMATRVGRLLFTEDWTTAQGPTSTRPAQQILTETNGPELLLSILHRIPASAQALAGHVPQMLGRLRPHLLTDDPDLQRDYRRGTTAIAPRFYGIEGRQVERLLTAYQLANDASHRAAQQIAAVAAAAHTPLPRADLDRIAYNLPGSQVRPPRTAAPIQQPSQGQQPPGPRRGI